MILRSAALALLISINAAPAGPAPQARSGTSVGWRRDGSGHFPDVTPPTEWSEKKNIKWQVIVGTGASSPVVSGDRVFVASEPGALVCLDRATGKPKWKADLKADLPGEIRGKLRPPVGTKDFLRATPVTDGKNVYVSLGDGLVACHAIDGTRRWVQMVEPAGLSYGPSASPLLVEDKLIVDSIHLKALEAATGKLIWEARGTEPHYGTPAVLSLEGAAFVVTAKGAVVRVSDGAVLLREIAAGVGGDQAPTPIVQDDIVYFACKTATAVKLGFKDGKLRAVKLWERPLPGDMIASPILHEGMLFTIPGAMPEYRVLDGKTGEILLQKALDLSTNFYPSLCRAGKYLFLGNDKGDMIVLEPGREYKEVARNDLPDGSPASPAFAGPNLFLRGGDVLYCIGP
jgi:hypothetical protein